MPESARHRMTGALRLCAPACSCWHALCVLGAGQGHAVRPARARSSSASMEALEAGPHPPRALSHRSHDFPRRGVRGLTGLSQYTSGSGEGAAREPAGSARSSCNRFPPKQRGNPVLKVQTRVEPETGSGVRSASYRPDSRRRREPLGVPAACGRRNPIPL